MEVRRKNIDFFKKVQEGREKMNNYSTDWKQVRIQAAIAAMQGVISNEGLSDDIEKLSKDVKSLRIRTAQISIEYADALVKELKGE